MVLPLKRTVYMYHLNWNRICNGKAVGFISKGLLLMVNPFEILHFVQKPVWNHKQVSYKPTVYLLLKEHVHCPFTEMHCFGTQICTIDFGTQMYFSKGERIHWKKRGIKVDLYLVYIFRSLVLTSLMSSYSLKPNYTFLIWI